MSDENVVGRDEFQRMLRDAEDGRFDCLLVWEIDRFGRERQDILTGKMTLKRAGVKPHIESSAISEKKDRTRVFECGPNVYGVRKRWICIFDRWIRTPEINESVTFYSALSGSQSSK